MSFSLVGKGDENMKKLMSLGIAMMLIGFCSMAYAIDFESEAGNQGSGLAVKNPEGESLGTVKDILVNFSGTVALVIISVGEKGDKEVAVPLGMFLYDEENEVLILKMLKEEIGSAPEFNVKRIYEFFGVPPPWMYETPQDDEGM